MAVRTGMANTITRLRGMTNAGIADFTVGAVSWFSDSQLQQILDTHRVDVYREPLTDQVTYDSGGTARYYNYYFAPGEYEEGTAAFIVATARGSALAGTVMNIDYQAGHISFGTVSQGGTAYYLTARRYDINAAAADVWRQKAAAVACRYDFASDGQSMHRSQMYAQFMQMAAIYDAQAEPLRVTMVRSDN
jgi:hypothetical protein